MLKRNITYTDYHGETMTKEFRFHLTKTELVGLEVKYKNGLEQALRDVIKTGDRKAMLLLFQDLILDSYGVVSDDGSQFMKSPEARAAFERSAAYDALFVELASDPNSAGDFINGIVPDDIAELAKEQDKPMSPPPPPKTAPLAPPSL